VTLLLLHAYPLDGRMWEPLRGALGGGDVAAPTLPGPELDDALERWAARLLADVQGDLVPIGSSMGGYVAFELWRRAPERIRGLVLADTKAGADDAEARAGREASIRVLRDDGFEPFWTGLAPKLFGPAVAPDVVARARSLAAEQPVDALVATLRALRDRPDSTPTLATIDVPVLVLVGEEDVVTPPQESERIAAGVGSARLVRISGAGHLSPLEAPKAFAAAVTGFLAEVPR
jgi:pimeloyl-ACP methyl ester carboxylesterase